MQKTRFSSAFLMMMLLLLHKTFPELDPKAENDPNKSSSYRLKLNTHWLRLPDNI